jgi:phosphoenolpyruvate synthase/pyruvate phosphate dikinase
MGSKMNWKIFVKHIIPIFFMDLIAVGMRRCVYELTGFHYLNYKKVSGFSYKDIDHDEQFFIHIVRQFNADEKCLARYLKAGLNQCRMLEIQAECLELACAQDPDPVRTFENLRLFANVYEGISPYLLLPTIVEKILTERIELIIEEKTGMTSDYPKFSEIFTALTTPRENTRFANSQEEILTFAISARKKGWTKSVNEAAEDSSRMSELSHEILSWAESYVNDYSWINYEHGYGSNYTQHDAIKRLAFLMEHNPETRLHDMNKAAAARKRRRRDFLRRHNLSLTERFYIDTMAGYVFFRNSRLESYNIAGHRIRPILCYLGSLLKMDYDEFVYLTFDEARNAVISNDQTMKDVTRERAKDYGLVMADGEIQVYEGKDVYKIKEEPLVRKDIDRLKGVIGNPGNAEGPARVVFDKKDFPKVKVGDIVVCSMTTPEYTIVLERAAGIATDLGGITSHQVQTARDLGIPCIISLGTATSVLQDDEPIRIDSDNSVLIRLNRFKHV